MSRCPACRTPLVAGACLRCDSAHLLWRAGEALLGRVRPDGRAARLVWKFFDPLQKEGLPGTWRRAVRMVRPPDRAAIARRVRALAAGATRPPVVILPSVDWDVALFQRPQQLARALARQGWPVFYGALAQSVSGGVHALEERLWVVEDAAAALEALPGAWALVASTAPGEVSVELLEAARRRGITLIYDFLDEIDESVQALSPALRARHRWLLEHADVVAVTADRLAEEVAAFGRTAGVIEVPNAADVAHFRPRPGRACPPELAALGDRPILGYYGALASWFDYALVAEVARARPDWAWVLIGVDYDRTLERAGLGALDNVHVLGPRRYAELPAYLDRFDVATVPFVKSDVTDATSPIKLFEYMAGERPIVTADLRECRKYDVVATAAGPAAFVAAVERALRIGRDPAHRARLAACAAANGWDRRATQLAEAAATHRR